MQNHKEEPPIKEPVQPDHKDDPDKNEELNEFRNKK